MGFPAVAPRINLGSDLRGEVWDPNLPGHGDARVKAGAGVGVLWKRWRMWYYMGTNRFYL